jgi:hypothetical protein
MLVVTYLQPLAEGPDLMYHFALEAFDLNTKLWGYPTCKNAFSMTPNVTRAKSEVRREKFCVIDCRLYYTKKGVSAPSIEQLAR